MSRTSVALALVAGVAFCIIVGGAVTAVARPWVEFSLFVGIPAGLVAGAVTAGAVYLGSTDDAPGRRRRVAGAVAAFGGGFIVALVALAWVLNLGATTALVGSVVVALVGAAVVYLRGSNGLATTDGDDGDTPRRTNP